MTNPTEQPKNFASLVQPMLNEDGIEALRFYKDDPEEFIYQIKSGDANEAIQFLQAAVNMIELSTEIPFYADTLLRNPEVVETIFGYSYSQGKALLDVLKDMDAHQEPKIQAVLKNYGHGDWLAANLQEEEPTQFTPSPS